VPIRLPMRVGHCNEGDRTGAQDRRHAGVEGDDAAPDLRPLRHARRRGAAEDGPGQVQAPAGGGQRRGGRHARHRQVPLRRHRQDGEGDREGEGGHRQRARWRRQVFHCRGFQGANVQTVPVRNRQYRLNVGSNTPSMDNILFIIFCRLLVNLKTSSHICELNLWISGQSRHGIAW
jgi:hypothetical protein